MTIASKYGLPKSRKPAAFVEKVKSVLRAIKARRKGIIIASACLLVVVFVLAIYSFLRPDQWHYYTDETSLRRYAKDIKPHLVLWEHSSPMSDADWNLPADMSEPAISPDGANLVFVRGLSSGNADMFTSHWTGRGWGPPEPMRALNSKFNEIGPSFSKDGKFLFFSSDRPGGMGGYDIWVARWDGGNYAWPLPLTKTVNSKFDDLGPAPDPKGNHLYFYSNRPRNKPKNYDELSSKELREKYKEDCDIFVADRIPAGLTNVDVEVAQSILYSLRETALSDPAAMQKLGGSKESETAVDRALDWLANAQETNGSWSIVKTGGQAGHDVAATAFSLLAFLGRGERQDRECKYQGTVSNALEWLLSQENKLTGDLRGRNPAGNAMYDNGAAALALMEAYGITKDPNLREPAQSAVYFLADAQNDEDGGWRYVPKQPGDMSVSGWVIMALKSAELSGLYVSKRTMDGIRKWLKHVSVGKDGGLYGYQAGSAGSPAMIAAGYFCSQLMGLSPNTLKAFEAADYLTRNAGAGMNEVYFAYYGTFAGYQNQGKLWREWNDKIQKSFLASQEADGSWFLKGGHGPAAGRAIGTALIALCLQAHYRYTPLYGLGYDPPDDRSRLSTAGLDQLPELPVYENAQRLFFNNVNSWADDVHPLVSEHGDFLYFASNRKQGGFGGFDVYRSRISGSEPLPPENLGPGINTEFDETAPALRMAGFDLVFCSNRDQVDKSKYQLYDTVSRRVFLRQDFSKLPTVGWMFEHIRSRLFGILAALLAFIYLLGRCMRKDLGKSRDREDALKNRTAVGGR